MMTVRLSFFYGGKRSQSLISDEILIFQNECDSQEIRVPSDINGLERWKYA